MNLCPQGGVGCCLFWVDIELKEYEGTERETWRVYPLRYVNFTKVIFRPIKRLKLMGSLFPKGPQTFIVCLPKMVCSLLIKYPMVSKMLLISPFRTYRGPNGRGKSSTRKGARDVECRRGKKALRCVSNGNFYLN